LSNSPDDVTNLIQMLIEAWPDSVCIPTHLDGMLPLHLAVRQGTALPLAAIQYLMQAWPPACKAPNKSGSLPLHVACANGAPLDIIQLLHQSWPKSTQVLNQYGWNALHSLCACIRATSSSASSASRMMMSDPIGGGNSNDCIRVVQYLVQHDPASVQVATYHYQDLPLHMACERSAPLPIIQCLVQADEESSIQARNAFGQLPLHKACAARRLSLDTIQYLVELWPASAMIQDVNGETPLDVLRRTKSHEIKEWLDRNNVMKRSRQQQLQQQDDDNDDGVVIQQESLGGGCGIGSYAWWQECPQSNLPTCNAPSPSGTTATAKKRLLAAALKHDGRAVALVAHNVTQATNLACDFARDWQEHQAGGGTAASSPQGTTRFVLWLNSTNEDSLRQAYLSAIVDITKSNIHVCGLPASANNNSTTSSKKRARHHPGRRLDSSVHALADELMCVLWHLPRHLQWMVVFANAPPPPPRPAAAAMDDATAEDVDISRGGVFFSNESNWWNSRGRILVTSSSSSSSPSSSVRLLTISVDQ
jgi:ankyrin repeat protein